MFPWYAIAMLGFESNSVINKRLAKIARGGRHSMEEIRLMFVDKSNAALEAGAALMSGGTMGGVVDGYRGHVAANEARLSA